MIVHVGANCLKDSQELVKISWLKFVLYMFLHVHLFAIPYET